MYNCAVWLREEAKEESRSSQVKSVSGLPKSSTHTEDKMSDRDRASTASPSLMEAGLKTLIGGRDSNYPLISGINGKLEKYKRRICEKYLL